jgi:hypothetical protein
LIATSDDPFEKIIAQREVIQNRNVEIGRDIMKSYQSKSSPMMINYFMTAAGLGSNPNLRNPLCNGALVAEDEEPVVEMLLERRALLAVGTMTEEAPVASGTGSMTTAAGRTVGARERNLWMVFEEDIVVCAGVFVCNGCGRKRWTEWRIGVKGVNQLRYS